MRRWLALALLLAACGSGDEPTLAVPDDTTTTASTTIPARSCPEHPPAFAPTWVPEGWSADLEPGSGGTEEQECDVWHWGRADGAMGSTVDVRLGDGAEALTPERSRTITVLGRPARIGPIHEGFMVLLDGYALKGYGITEEDLERLAVGLHPHGPRVAPETSAPVPDGLHAARIVGVGDATVTVDLIGWYSGDEANRIAAERGDETPVPNDYYTVNDDPATPELPVADDVAVTSPWAEYGSDGCELCQRVITFERLRELFTGPVPDSPQGNVRHSPFWITVHDGEVTRIDEQYVP